MKSLVFPLTPRLSIINWNFVESFILVGMFCLPFSKSIAEICFITAMCIWLLRKVVHGETFLYFPYCTTAHVLLLFAIVLSLVNVPGIYMETALRGFVKWFKYLTLFSMCGEIYRDPKRLMRFISVFFASMACVAVNGLIQMQMGHDLIKGYAFDVPGRFPRMRSSFQSPNDLGAFMLLAIPLSAGLMVRSKVVTKRNVTLAAVFALSCTALISSLSRSALFALLLSLIIFCIFRKAKRALLLVVLGLTLMLTQSETLKQNFVTSLNPNDITIGERMRIWKVSAKMVRDHPVLGIGVNMYVKKFSDYKPPTEKYVGYAHNSYLQVLSELGILGLLIFLYPICAVMTIELFRKRPIHNERRSLLSPSDAVWIGLAAFLIQSAVDTNFFALQTMYLFWMFWGAFQAIRMD